MIEMLVIQAVMDCDECNDNNIEVTDGIIVCAGCGKPITSGLDVNKINEINVWRD